jgi:outer membrane protein TolC
MFRAGTRHWALGTSLLLTLIASSATAQTPAAPKVTFDEAIQRAVTSNPTIAQAATAITRAELLVRQAQAGNRPAVSATFTNSTLDSEIAFSAGVAQPRNQSTISGAVTAPILSLSRWAGVTQARDQVQVAQLATESTRRDIAVATAQAFLTVIVAQRAVDVDARAVETARAHLTYSQQRLQAGAGSRLNELRAATALSTSEMRLENSRLALRRAQEALGVLVAADTPIDAAAEPAFEIPATINEQEWAQARPDVRTQQATQRAFERIVRDSWRDMVGNASVSFNPQVVAPAGLFQPTNTWRLTVSFTQPIFEGGLRKAVKSARELQVEQTRLVLAGIMIRARSEVRLAGDAIRSQERALESARLAATQATDVLRITTQAFEVGGTTNIEVIDAQRSARDADATAALAEDAVRRAKLDLLIAIGRFPR